MSDLIQETTDATFALDVLDSDIPVLVDFWAPWCGPCKAFAPVLTRLAEQHAGKVKIVKYNVDQNPDSYQQFKIRGVPTLIAMRGGEEVARATGASASALRTLLDSLLLNAPAVDAKTHIEGRYLGAFGSDAERKRQCMQRVEMATTEGLLDGVHADVDSFANGAYLPSVLLGQGTCSLSEEVNMPVSLVSLLDFYHEKLKSEKLDMPVALSWLNAIAVGADLRRVPFDFALYLLDDAEHGVIRNLGNEDAVVELISKTTSLHATMQAPDSNAAPLADWATIRKRAESLAQSADKPLKGLLHAASKLMRPYDKFDASAFSEFIEAIGLFEVMRINETWWSPQEAAVLKRQAEAIANARLELGARPSEEQDRTSVEEYDRQYKHLVSEIKAEMHHEYAGLADRQVALRNEIQTAMSRLRVASWHHVLSLFSHAHPVGS